MSTNQTEGMTAVAKILESWAAMQESQASAWTEQLEVLRVQAGLQMQALVQLVGGGEATAARQNTPHIHLPKMAAEDDGQAFLEVFEVAAEACQWPREEWVPIAHAVGRSTAGCP